MKIDPYCQQWNCSPLNVLFSDAYRLGCTARLGVVPQLGGGASNVEMAKTSLHTHTRLSRAYLALARLSCKYTHTLDLWQIKGQRAANGRCPLPLVPLSRWFLRERDARPESPTLHYVLRNLKPGTWYQLEVIAQNSIGWSDPNDRFCFRTAEG